MDPEDLNSEDLNPKETTAEELVTMIEQFGLLEKLKEKGFCWVDEQIIRESDKLKLKVRRKKEEQVEEEEVDSFLVCLNESGKKVIKTEKEVEEEGTWCSVLFTIKSSDNGDEF